MLTELDELLDWLDSSSIDRICRRPEAERGPGNWRLPVWKLKQSGSLTSPLLRVSTNVACQM